MKEATNIVHTRWPTSTRHPSDVSILSHCLAAAMPELVAYTVGANWYASGVCVRGNALSHATNTEGFGEISNSASGHGPLIQNLPAELSQH